MSRDGRRRILGFAFSRKAFAEIMDLNFELSIISIILSIKFGQREDTLVS
jgi:hypothetical protein